MIVANPFSASPEEIATAVFASKAWMSRKSSESRLPIAPMVHVAPPSVVRTNRAREPEIQTTFELTTLSPRNDERVGTFSFSQPPAATANVIPSSARNLLVISTPPERNSDDAVKSDQHDALEPDRFPVGDDDADDERRHEKRDDEQRRQDERQHRPAEEERREHEHRD